MPGATETEFFERAEMLDTKIGQSKKDDPVDVAKAGYEAMMSGEGDVVTVSRTKYCPPPHCSLPRTFWRNSIARWPNPARLTSSGGAKCTKLI
jgi:short-subunit dehydrogenase